MPKGKTLIFCPSIKYCGSRPHHFPFYFYKYVPMFQFSQDNDNNGHISPAITEVQIECRKKMNTIFTAYLKVL